MKKLLSLSALALGTLTLAFALTHCGGSSFSCDTKSKCSGDQAQTDAEKMTCTSALAGKCSTQYKAFGQCAVDNQKCDMNNMTDASALLASCASQYQAYQTCSTSM